ncbi:Uncharacterized protein HZ326_27262 [Fusarium oxysporum f. sp. albedinis]|nr:Uncharacterized protein HZ326_27262 [Fusarium oxysporum f. sp. albedinis]
MASGEKQECLSDLVVRFGKVRNRRYPNHQFELVEPNLIALKCVMQPTPVGREKSLWIPEPLRVVQHILFWRNCPIGYCTLIAKEGV